MKTTTRTPALVLLGAALVLSASSACAHSPGSPATHLSNAAAHSGAASAQAVGASGEVGLSAVKATSGAAALAFWTGGSVVAGSGQVVTALGDSTTQAGTAATQGADKMWDFATGAPQQRPAANRTRSVPPPKQIVHRDPPPSVAIQAPARQ